MSARALRVSRTDDVVMAMEDISQGDKVDVVDKDGSVVAHIKAIANIPRFHKIALQNIKAGSPVRKYGEIIGIATANIHVGGYVHVHNIESAWFHREPPVGPATRGAAMGILDRFPMLPFGGRNLNWRPN